MYRTLWGIVCFLLLGAVGCGKSTPTQGEQELTEQQNNAQRSVDDEERQWQKNQKK